MSNPNFGPGSIGPERPPHLELSFNLVLQTGPLRLSYETGRGVIDLRFNWEGEGTALSIRATLGRPQIVEFPLLALSAFPRNVTEARQLLAQIAPMRTEIDARRLDLGVHTIYPMALDILNDLQNRAQRLIPPPLPSVLSSSHVLGAGAA